MNIVCVLTSVELFLLIILCILKCNGANQRNKGDHENTRNLGISLNISILDVSSAFDRDRGSSLSEYPETSNGNRRRAPQDEYVYQGHTTTRPGSQSENFDRSLQDSHQPHHQQSQRHQYNSDGGVALNSYRGHGLDNQHNYDNKSNNNAPKQPSSLNHQIINPSTAHRPTNDFYGHNNDHDDDSNRETSQSGQRPTKRPKPDQEIYHSNTGIPSHSSRQQSYYDNNREVVRRPGQSGYQGNDKGISSTVDSFNGNVNVGSTRRPQVSGQNSGLHSGNNVNAQSHRENGYSSGIDDGFDRNDNTGNGESIQGSYERKPGGNSEVYKPEISTGYREDESSKENDRKTITELQGSGRKPSNDESGFKGGRSGGGSLIVSEEYTTTVRSTTRDYYDRTTSKPRTSRRTTSRPESRPDDESNGCNLPRQPRGGHYELGGCDSPCDKEPGDVVPNTSVLTYTCDNGFVRNGSAVSVCLNNSWYMPPSCLRTCPPLESTSIDITCKLRGSKVPCDEPMEPDTRAILACKPSYKIPLTEDPAYREITCMEDGLWDRQLLRCLPKCGTTIAHGSTLVVNGFTAKVGVFPWHVGIYERKSRHVYEQICAGTLINSNIVVSAAHCFYDETTNELKPTSKYYAAAGKHYRSWNTEEDYIQKSQISKINIAHRYIGARGNFAQDIALLEMKNPFELTDLVRPACVDWDNVLEREHLQVGRYGKAVGWGKTSSGEPSEKLQEINVPFVSFDQCVADVPKDFRGYITPDKFCAGYRNGSGLCEGDSGGGLCFESNGLWYLRGIVSVSPVRNHSCDYMSYTAFTYFSHFREWARTYFLKL